MVCTITYDDRTAHTTAGDSLFEAVANAIVWIEVDRRSFGTARMIPDDEILTVHVVGGGIYRFARAASANGCMRHQPDGSE